jgi:acyl-CoA thioester hydrolase
VGGTGCSPHACGDSTRVEGYGFSTEVTVRFADTDAQGVAHNKNYLVWYEVARIDWLARYVGGYKRIQEAGYEALTTESHVRYVAPAYFDDRLRVHARCGGLRGARFRFEYVIERDGQLIADGWTTHAVVDRETLRPTRLPVWFAEAAATAETESASRPPAAGREG